MPVGSFASLTRDATKDAIARAVVQSEVTPYECAFPTPS